jgi:segregation and condensation protein B
MTDTPITVKLPSLVNQLEALLFAASGQVAPGQLAAALELPLRDIEEGLNVLEAGLSQRGIRLQRHAGRLQLTTAPEFAPAVERFAGLEASNRLSRAALEALAIIAYQQPVTRPEIDAIRGVNSDGVLKSLLSKGLIEEAGRAERPGRPILYNSTSDFLSHFGLASLAELPPVAELPNADLEKPAASELLKT